MSFAAIPETLWQEEKIRMPPLLVAALREEMVARSVLDAACGPFIGDKDLFGGKGEQDALQHFTHRFKTSSARVEFVVLNPNGTFEAVSTDLISCLLDGSVAILDIPCGSGGGLLGLLATVAELRTHGKLPPLPLDATILAGDCSPDARAIHESMLQRLQPSFDNVGMHLRWQHADWDVTCPFSTSTLMDNWFQLCPNCEEYLVFVSAFSGFAAKNIDTVLQAVRDIAVRCHTKVFLIAWIEPINNESKKLLPRLWESLSKLFRLPTKGKSADLQEVFEYLHPFTGEIIPGRARVLPFEKVKQ